MLRQFGRIIWHDANIFCMGRTLSMTENMKPPETGVVRMPVVLYNIPVSKTTWWNSVKSGRFPKSVKLGSCITA